MQCIRVLGRLLEWTADGITWEADPCQLATPDVRDKLDDTEGEVPIDKESGDRDLADTMRAEYFSSYRPVIHVECPDLARLLQQPPNLDEMGLTRLARFLGVRPRLVWLRQKRVMRIEPGAIRTTCADVG